MDFYRIDTALLVPRPDINTWRLRVTGMVDRPIELTYDELVNMPLVEQYVTIACVSNEVGGNLVGNALWRGVRLKALLQQAGVDPAATQIVGRAVDGFTVGFPTGYAIADDREPLVAVGMNGEPLPVDHGFPARLIVPGLFGYVSATKWLTEIELTTWEAFDAYWVPLGWAKEGPILTQSRIDVPRGGARLDPGTVTIAGVAWAPDRGVTGVELQIDEGDWTPATISTPSQTRRGSSSSTRGRRPQATIASRFEPPMATGWFRPMNALGRSQTVREATTRSRSASADRLGQRDGGPPCGIAIGESVISTSMRPSLRGMSLIWRHASWERFATR